MTITYPRALPHHRLVDCTFSLVEPVSLSRGQGGRAVAAVEFADPYITATFETPPMSWRERSEWEAWRASLRGGLKSFITYDVSRSELAAYPDGVPEIIAETWNGQGAATTVAGYQITASGVPNGFKLMPGDLIGLQAGNPLRRWVGFVSEEATAGASTITVPVEPALPTTIFGIGATVVFYRPHAEFILLSDTWSCSKRDFLAPVSFEAVQKI